VTARCPWPFTEAKEVIGGFGLINAKDRAEAIEYAQRYADLFEEVGVEVRQVARVRRPAVLTYKRGLSRHPIDLA
jgi:hypothetical protein